jgi:hypothetical protein
MKKTIFQATLSFSILTLLLCFATPAFAHGGDPRLEISADRLNPGSALDVRGVDFEFEEKVTLDLVGPQGVTSFGTVLADTEGIFLLTITLPFDLVEGTYVLRATTDDHQLESPPITVSGSADTEQGQQRELEEPLLAPMPTVAAGVATSIPPASVAEPAAAQRSSTWLLSTVGAIGIVLILGMLFRMRR